ncbi:ABC transporter ATP-binding protein [Micromonospora okii]|uniref:ABC transporter ATP-binding protein n=1 Tax=Micromonospora okii TaxID=1182970 RepID=UPI001E3A5891|nr:ABC transporter ATP-binding protein [Micromonospora okii]
MTQPGSTRDAGAGTPVAGPEPAAVTPGTRLLARRAMAAVGLAAHAAPPHLMAYVLVTVAAGGLPVVVAWLTKLVLDTLAGAADPGRLVGLGLGLAAAALATGLIPQVGTYLRAELDRAVGLLAQDRLFTAVDGFVGLGRFEDPAFLDRLRLARQAGEVMPNQVSAGLLAVGRVGLTVSGFLTTLFVLSPLLAGLVLASGALVLVAEIVLARQRATVAWEIGPAERREFFHSQLLTTVQAVQEVRLFGIGAFLRGRMLADRRDSNARKRAVDRRQVRLQAGLGVLAALVSGAGLLWAVQAARSGRLSVGDVTLFIAAVAGVQAALAALAGEVARAHHALLMFGHYVAVTTAGPDLPTPREPQPLPALRRGVEFRDVWFRYSDRHPWVLRGVDLHIPYGQTVGLVGVNGAGKSTIVKLLCRFYDPTRGRILWDGVDLRAVDVAELRRRIGAVFQDYMHYEMTAAENIGLGDLAVLGDRSRVRAAAVRAGIDEGLAALPHGYDTLLSRMFLTEAGKDDPETGVALSGGQWQRLALARAFLRDRRDLMILDEPSAGLDAAAEHEIHTSLRRHRAGRTSVLVSHRLGTLRDADSIVVLRDGRIAEQGDHRSLVAAGGEYARLFALQAAGYQDQPVTTATGDRP